MTRHGMGVTRRRSRSLLCLAVVAGLVAISACKPRIKPASAVEEAVDAQDRGKGAFPIWAYDGAPDPATEQGRQLIELNSSIPYFPGLSNAVYGDQMFRPAFGPIPWRLLQKPDSVKILFIGQDGTHIAEAAGRPATAGFGGRAQDLAKHFGVSSSAAFINTYAFTIRWQYGAFDTPMITTRNGKQEFSFASFTGTPVWLISQDLSSPIVQWRNKLIEWILRNNKNSLKMIVLFGGAARDAAGTFIEAHGGKVATRMSAEKINQLKVKIPEFDLKGAGSNKQAATPMDTQGRDMLVQFAAENGISFTQNDYKTPAKVDEIHQAFIQKFNANPTAMANKMVLPPDRDTPFNPADPHDVKGTGMVHPAQMGGYDLGKAISIKGLNLSSASGLGADYTIPDHLVVVQLPHPTALSMLKPAEASATVNKALEAIKAKFPAESNNESTGWYILPDTDAIDPDTNQPLINRYAKGDPYKYGRADMGTEYYDFGAPNSRMVNVSTASRDGANVIIFGTRAQPVFDTNAVKNMTSRFYPSAWNGNPNPPNREFPFDDEMFIARATHTDGTINASPLNRRYTFDSGPGVEMAKIMKKNLPRNPSFVPQNPPESNGEPGGPVNGDFGHYRGTFNRPRVVILADPDGDDDLITARALTGTRGQYLNNLMFDLGVNDQYLIIKTAPYSNYSDNNPQSEGSQNWLKAIAATKDYRKKIFEEIMKAPPEVVMLDGDFAVREFTALYPQAPGSTRVIQIARQGLANNSGIKNAGSEAVATGLFKGPNGETPTLTEKMRDIPRSHLSYYARVWEGTSGDRVITAQGNFRGKAFAEVAPRWAYSQPFKMVKTDMDGCIRLVKKQFDYRVRLGQQGPTAESVTGYRTRMTGGSSGQMTPEKICARAGSVQVAPSEGGPAVAANVESMEMPDPNEPHGVDDMSDKIKYVFEE